MAEITLEEVAERVYRLYNATTETLDFLPTFIDPLAPDTVDVEFADGVRVVPTLRYLTDAIADISSGGDAVWGSITGLITNQEDLVWLISEAAATAIADADIGANWGSITGTIADQTDLTTRIDSRVAAAVSGLSMTATWGSITGSIAAQTDLITRINSAVSGLGSTATWGGIGGVITAQPDLGAHIDAKISTALSGFSTTATWGEIVGDITAQSDLISRIESVVSDSITGAVADLELTATWGEIVGAVSDQMDLITHIDSTVATAVTAAVEGLDVTIDEPTDESIDAMTGATPYAWTIDQLRKFVDVYAPPAPAFTIETFEPYARKDEPITFEHSAIFESGAVLIDRVTGVHFRLVVDDGSLSIEAV